MTEKAVCAVEYAMMGLAALAGGVIQPLTGFGAAVIMMVAASAFYDMTIAPTIVALICMAQSGTMTWMYRKHIDVKQIALPIGLYTVCSLVIINLLGNFDLHVLTALFGAFLIALAAYFLLFAKRVKLDQPGLAAGLVCSAFSGCCAGAFTIGGPMMALYFVAIARSKETYVGNMQFLFFTTNLINFTMRTVRGYFSAALLPMAGLGMACILLGLWIGTRLSRKMSGDVALNVFQSLPVDGVIIVASPQDLVSMVVQKAVKMAQMMNIPIVGLVENMSYVQCPDCGKKLYIFGEGKTEEAAKAYHIPLLAKMPIDPALAKLTDDGCIEQFEGHWLDGVVETILRK